MVRPPLHRNAVSFKPIKFVCSYGGKILPRYPDGKLRYRGGETRLLAVHRSVSFPELLLKLGELCGISFVRLRCQLPREDLDALVSITSDEDLANLIEEYDRAASASSFLKIRAFLLPPKHSKRISPPPSPASFSSSSSLSSSSSSSSLPIPFPRVPIHRCYFRQMSPPNAFIYLENNSASAIPHSVYHGNSSQKMFILNGNHWD